MRGVVFLGDRLLELREFPDPTPGPGEVVIAIKASGMCGSDLHAYRARGNAAAALGFAGGGPVIAGHEPCGVVAAVGAGVTDVAVGQRVMNHHYAGCGRCAHCRQGWSQLCPNGFIVYGVTGHGGHAPFMKVPARTLVSLPDELSFEEGAAISCGTGTLDVSPDLLRRQLTLLASWTFSAVGQEECARFIAERQIPLGRLLTHRFALDQAAEAYRLFDTQTTGKGVFVF